MNDTGPGSVDREVKLSDVEFDTSLQARAEMDQAAVEDYAERYKTIERRAMPTPVVFEEKGRFYIGDGWHRITAAMRAGLESLVMEVVPGGRRAAIEYAISANQRHGVRRTNADKRRAVEIALRELEEMSDRSVAAMCGVSDKTVATVRKQVCSEHTSEDSTAEIPQLNEGDQLESDSSSKESTGDDPQLKKRVGRDGKARKLPERSRESGSRGDGESGSFGEGGGAGEKGGEGSGVDGLSGHRYEEPPSGRTVADLERALTRANDSMQAAQNERLHEQERRMKAEKDMRDLEGQIKQLCLMIGCEQSMTGLRVWCLTMKNKPEES